MTNTTQNKWKIEFKDTLTVLERQRFLELGGTVDFSEDVMQNYATLLKTEIASIKDKLTKITKEDKEFSIDEFLNTATEIEVAEIFSEIQAKQAEIITKKKKS